MMALVAEGFDSCPMEGFDEKRIKNIKTQLAITCSYEFWNWRS